VSLNAYSVNRRALVFFHLSYNIHQCRRSELGIAVFVSLHTRFVYIQLALGIERCVIGDIAVTDDHTAVLFVKAAMAEYLTTALERIGSDKVHIRPLPDEEAIQTPDTRRWEMFSDTVASLRLDGIVSAATNLSRDRAKQLVSGGFVDVDFRPCDAPDTELTAGTYLSIRGHGRYLFSDVDGTSKKGRIRIRIKKLI
jgi:RNA-binding protein YlmH